MRKISRIIQNNLIQNIIGIAGSQVVAAIITLLITPLYIEYFDNNGILGVWLTIVSLIDSATILDLGVGNGMRNKLTEALALGDKNAAKMITSSCYLIVIPFLIILLIAWSFIVRIGDWNKFFNIDSEVVSLITLQKSVLIVGYAIIIQLFFKLISSVLFALQRAALVNWLIVISNALLVFFLFCTRNMEIDNKILVMAIAYSIFINLPYITFSILVFSKEVQLIPSRSFFSFSVAKETLKLGLLFFYLTLMSLLTHNTNEILVTYLFSPEVVVDYQVYNKIFMLITAAVTVFHIPIWSAVTKELTLNNYEWIKKAHNYMCALGGLACIGGIFLMLIMQFIADAWLGSNSITVNLFYCIPFVLYVTENTIGGANATVANGCGWLKAQIMLAPVSAILNVPITIILKYVIGNWTAIVYANVLSLIPITIGQYVYIRRKINV